MNRDELEFKIALVREVESMCWNMARQIFPVVSCLMKIDWDLYRKHGMQDHFRRISNLNDALKESVQSFKNDLIEMKGESSDD